MTAMSNYLENKVVDHVCSTTSFTMPANVYLALFTSNPSDDASGSEVSGGDYARTEVTAFDAASGGAAANTGTITFPTPSGANWGTITHFGLFDAPTSGNLLVYGALSASIVVNDGDSAPSFPAGALTITGT